MSRLAINWSRLRAWSASHDAELRLCVRSTTAAVLTLAAAQLLNLPIALWAVLTAVILTQISVGRSLKVVSLAVLPARAHDLAIEAATHMLELMAQFPPELFAGFRQDLDRRALGDMQNRIGEALGRLDRMAAEATHERITRLGAEPDQRPLLRPMVRRRHDLVMTGRAGMAPLPEPFRSRLGAYLARVSETAADYLRASATVLLARQGSPSLDPVESALDGHAAEF